MYNEENDQAENDEAEGTKNMSLTAEKDGMVESVDEDGEMPGFATQLKYLVRREALNVVRDKVSLIARIGTTVFINLLIGIIFTGSADWSDVDGTNLGDVVQKANSHF